MFKIFAAILICAVCMSPVAEATAAYATTVASPVQNLNQNQINRLGLSVGVPLLAPNNVPFASLVAASLPARTYVGQSHPVLLRTPQGNTRFIGESILAMVAM